MKEYKADKFFKLEGTGYDLEDMMAKPEYFKYEKGRVLEIKHMTPIGYLRESAVIHKGNMGREMAMIDAKLVEKYALMMQSGIVFPMPIIDYDRNGQEGRHRAMAIRWLVDNGIIESTLVPVAVIKPYKASEEEMSAYWKRKWG